ncbi:MAG: hypothetical protein QF565_06625, partial [Arenicellales bacterium]|nr:hypothetical protein [Arenicellales bacterium]
PPRKDLVDMLAVRVNNIPLTDCVAASGWFKFRPDPNFFAVGENLVGVLVCGRNPRDPPITVEKVELHVEYIRNP